VRPRLVEALAMDESQYWPLKRGNPRKLQARERRFSIERPAISLEAARRRTPACAALDVEAP
jgi:hypothetical protein